MHGAAGFAGNAVSARGAHRRAGSWHCLAPLRLIRAAWAPFCCWRGSFLLGEWPTTGKEEGADFLGIFFPWVYLSQPSILMLTKDPLKFASSWQLHRGALPKGAREGSLPTSPCSSLPGGEARVLSSRSEWEFSRLEQRDCQVSLLSQEAFPFPPVLGAANLPAGNEILFQKDLGFSHDPGMKVWAGFRHKSRNSQNLCAAFFGAALGRRGGDLEFFFQAIKAAECQAERLIPALPRPVRVFRSSLLQNSS